MLMVVGNIKAQSPAVQGVQPGVPAVDKRTLREKAEDVLSKKGNDSLAAAYLESWLAAVPTDAEAAQILSVLCGRLGRKADSAVYIDLAWKNGYSTDQRVKQYLAKQQRYGRYKVLMPSVVKPNMKYPMVLLLHGNGNSADMMIQLARNMKLDSVIFVCPEAPYLKSKESHHSVKERYSASGDGYGAMDSILSDVIQLSAEWYYQAFLSAKSNLPASNVKPLIVGYSQGGFYALSVATRHPESFGGVATINASMYDNGNVMQNLDKLRTHGVGVLVSHGRSDMVVPFQTAELIVGGLASSGVNYSFYPTMVG
jgi:predicted esterase